MLALVLATLLAPAEYGLAKLKPVLPSDVALTANTGPECKLNGPEALSIRKTAQGQRNVLALCGSDATGLMYAALEAARQIRAGGFAAVRDVREQPYLKERAISTYTMQRAYFEQRLHDRRYWERYFDMLAASRINSFVIIFGYENGGFMAPLYPFFFDTPQFDGVRLVGITPEQQKRNTESFRALIDTAHERGIRITAGIWDHIYRGGVQGGGIAGASEQAGKAVPGLATGLDADNLSAYTKAALRRFLETFPALDAIQFRMHDESGLKPAEMESFWHEVFGMIRQMRPAMRIDLRAKGLPDSIIADALDQGLKARVHTKYWMEQVGLPFHPTHVNRQDQRNRRHGYADLLSYPQRYQMVWQLWTGGTTRLLLWGDPDYVKRFAASARLYASDSIEVNEMLATKMLGSPHDEKPVEILNARYRYYDYEFERYWHFYTLWGRLTYNPETPPDTWESEWVRRFGVQAGPRLMRAMHAASRVLPRIVAAAYRYQYFPTTRGWAEMMRQGSLQDFATLDGSDIEQFESPREEAKRIAEGRDTPLRRPQETAAWFARTAEEILKEVALTSGKGNEYVSTITDLKILAGLARYYAERLPAAVAYNYGDHDAAFAGERRAIEAWRSIVAAATDVYSENLAFGVHRVGFPRHWKEELAALERDLAALEAKPRAASRTLPREVETGDRTPPVVHIEPSGVAVPGQDYVVRVRAEDPSGVKIVRLRYRHLTQYEDYESVEMTGAGAGLYQARIPGAFVTPRWDLMFFVEAIDMKGNGHTYPDLDVETPYVVVGVRR